MDYSFTGSGVEPALAAPEAAREPQANEKAHTPGRTSWPIAAIAIIQSIFFLGHWLLYVTWTSFWSLSPSVARPLAVCLLVLSVAFTIASALSFRSSSVLVSLLYRASAIWVGFLNFLVWAACLAWIADLAFRLAFPVSSTILRPWIATTLFSVALLVSLCGFVNARFIRTRHVTVELPNLPDAWHRRKALLISDMHLGHINQAVFARRVAGLARQLNPEIIFIAGDLYDGSRVDAYRLAAPLFELAPPLGIYFAGGNHEEFGDAADYERALRKGGIQILHGELADVEGVKIIGVPYSGTTYPMHFRTFLESLALNDGTPSILLNHVPNRLPIVEKAGVSLQLSGHTHGGQIFPFTWFTRRAFGKFTYGLQRFGKLQVLISSGAGTWGPPMRVGTSPEVVLITFTSQNS